MILVPMPVEVHASAKYAGSHYYCSRKKAGKLIHPGTITQLMDLGDSIHTIAYSINIQLLCYQTR